MISVNEIRENLAKRPLWMNGVMLFCAFMALVYMPWDIFLKPVAEDQEVWFGVMLTGWAAKATAPLHWLIYGAGALGFWQMKSWMHPWASLYVAQIALGMFVWSMLYTGQSSLLVSAIVSLAFIALSAGLWRSKALFGKR